jgi:cobalt/nickel transport system permease protein
MIRDMQPSSSQPYLLIAVAAISGAIAVATLPANEPGWVLLGCLMGLLLAGRLTPAGRLGKVLQRGLLVGPFILFLALLEFFRVEPGQQAQVLGIEVPLAIARAVGLLLKTFTAVSIGLAWGERVGAHGIARSLHRARAPAATVAVTFLAVNFLSTLGREWEGVRLAARARGLSRASYGFRLRQLGSSLMSVLVRSIWRGDRVALAMRARGYAGRLPEPIAAEGRVDAVTWLVPAAAGAIIVAAVLARTVS